MVVGEWRWYQYEDAFAKGLEHEGVEVSRLITRNYFNGYFDRIQLIFPFISWSIFRLNKVLLDRAIKESPDWILFWRPTHILPSVLKKIKKNGINLASYNNDDPFRTVHYHLEWKQKYIWYWYLKSLSFYDRNFFYRKINCREALRYGVRHADIIMPYYIPWQDRPVKLSNEEYKKFSTDVVFVGHYEPDGRDKSILRIIQSGYQVKIWGGNTWSRIYLERLKGFFPPIQPAEGNDYPKALCGAKICLAFLSKLNRDTYTRRCFEIPACGQVMLAERTNDLLRFFKEDEEACFFSSNEELVQKVSWLMNNPNIREKIAQAGYRRLLASNHDVLSRSRQFIGLLQNI